MYPKEKAINKLVFVYWHIKFNFYCYNSILYKDLILVLVLVEFVGTDPWTYSNSHCFSTCIDYGVGLFQTAFHVGMLMILST